MTKPTKWHMRPAKTQIRLGMPTLIRVLAVRLRKLGEDSDQTGWMPRLIFVFAGRTVIVLVLSLAAHLGIIFHIAP